MATKAKTMYVICTTIGGKVVYLKQTTGIGIVYSLQIVNGTQYSKRGATALAKSLSAVRQQHWIEKV